MRSKSIMWGSLDGAAWDIHTRRPKAALSRLHVQLLSAVKQPLTEAT
jgi:hypothetical protein